MIREKDGINAHLSRRMGLMTLTATGICSMLGASIYVVPFMIQRNVPGIGAYVIPAFLCAALPAVFAALAYAILSSAMPRAGGSYIYASRGLHPYLGFVASFSQWFGLSIVIGVIAYITIPFVRDVCSAMGWVNLATVLETGWIRVVLALSLIWIFVLVNIRGTKSYKRTLIPMMFLMFALGTIVIIAGFRFDTNDFIAAIKLKEDRDISIRALNQLDWRIFLSAAALLFSSFIGFDSIAQAGGEARNPGWTLPRAILLAIFSVGSFYILFTAAVYHTVPWSFVAEEALVRDITAPGLLGIVLPAEISAAIIAGAAIALINDLPAMLLSVSRLMFAWAADGIFPSSIASIHPGRKTPVVALCVAGIMSSIGVLGSHWAGDFFLGIDIMVTSMMVNFLLMCVTLVMIPKINPDIAQKIVVFKNRLVQSFIGWIGIILLLGFLTIHTFKDLTSEVSAWYFRSTPVYLIVMTIASLIFILQYANLKNQDVNISERFTRLPQE